MQEVSQTYAQSLWEVASQHDIVDTVRDQLGEFADVLADNRDLQVFFFSPYFTSTEKKDGIHKLLEDADEHFVRFLELLAERHRMPVIFRIRREFERLWAERQQLISVEVTSAVDLDEETTKGIGKKIEEQTGLGVELSSKVDPEVLGGLVIRVGNMVLDATIRSRLERLRREVARAA